jgi:hypothetical protein
MLQVINLLNIFLENKWIFYWLKCKNMSNKKHNQLKGILIKDKKCLNK